MRVKICCIRLSCLRFYESKDLLMVVNALLDLIKMMNDKMLMFHYVFEYKLEFYTTLYLLCSGVKVEYQGDEVDTGLFLEEMICNLGPEHSCSGFPMSLLQELVHFRIKPHTDAKILKQGSTDLLT